MSVKSMAVERRTESTILKSNAAESFVSAINKRLFESDETLSQRAQLSDVSARLRLAFSFEPDALPQLPLQLGQDHHKANKYLEEAIEAWRNSQCLADLFEYLRLDETTISGVQSLLSDCIRVQTLSAWICNEFGEIRTSRQALHARRYVAIKMTQEAISVINGKAHESEDTPAKRQAQLDIWTDLECPLQYSLHHRTVIAPICNWLLRLEAENHAKALGKTAANEDVSLKDQRLAKSDAASAESGTDYVDAAVLRKGLRTIS